ncbi:CYTH domain-containing protein [Caldalkalibacillus salinus]|uniref:CYTH domain-containing protein n=1 Tax=Caldalkalibacillus salinus TaxID=2803787 RepID=UPI0019239075|nr:CYTH domain-containing protein [Caldalkalibacillus salinus]
MGIEIERKYQLNQFPQEEIDSGRIQILASQIFEQTYLALSEEQEIRVRKAVYVDQEEKSVQYTHTFKKGHGMAREEIEYRIDEEIYNQLMEGKTPLVKKRTVVEYDKISMEIDEYKGFDLITVEVEFNTEEEALAFEPPSWFGEEVGSKKEYRNKTLWKSLQTSFG